MLDDARGESLVLLAGILPIEDAVGLISEPDTAETVARPDTVIAIECVTTFHTHHGTHTARTVPRRDTLPTQGSGSPRAVDTVLLPP